MRRNRNSAPAGAIDPHIEDGNDVPTPPDARSRSVEVLLATWNGEAFLAEQLRSLMDQSCRDFTILVADDGSRDATLAILADHERRYPGRLRLLPPAPRHLGAAGTFGRLLAAAGAERVFTCDQDDIWLPDKIERSLRRMDEVEAQRGADTPVLVHSDLAVVDAGGRILGPSFARYARIDPRRNALNHLLLGNVATGCTILVNRALLDRAVPMPRDALMYDHWLALVAAATGAISYIDEPLILYRQHGRNTVGARPRGPTRFGQQVVRTLVSGRTTRTLRRYSDYAGHLADGLGDRLDEADRRRLRAMATVWALPRWRRFAHLWSNGLRKPTLLANLGMFAALLRRR